eukprot:m51a1_g509 hypothetical protein (596) ;mRNA; f:303766-306837
MQECSMVEGRMRTTYYASDPSNQRQWRLGATYLCSSKSSDHLAHLVGIVKHGPTVKAALRSVLRFVVRDNSGALRCTEIARDKARILVRPSDEYLGSVYSWALSPPRTPEKSFYVLNCHPDPAARESAWRALRDTLRSLDAALTSALQAHLAGAELRVLGAAPVVVRGAYSSVESASAPPLFSGSKCLSPKGGLSIDALVHPSSSPLQAAGPGCPGEGGGSAEMSPCVLPWKRARTCCTGSTAADYGTRPFTEQQQHAIVATPASFAQDVHDETRAALFSAEICPAAGIVLGRSRAMVNSSAEPTALTYQTIYWPDGSLQRRTVTVEYVCAATDHAALNTSLGTARRLTRIGHCRSLATKAGSRKISPLVRVYELSYLDDQRWFHEGLVSQPSVTLSLPESPRFCTTPSSPVCPTSPITAPSSPVADCAAEPPAKRARQQQPQPQPTTAPSSRAGDERLRNAARLGAAVASIDARPELTLVIHVHNVFPTEHHEAMNDVRRSENSLAALGALERRLAADPEALRMLRVGFVHGLLLSAWRQRRAQDVSRALGMIGSTADAETPYAQAVRRLAAVWDRDYFACPEAAVESLGSLLF